MRDAGVLPVNGNGSDGEREKNEAALADGGEGSADPSVPSRPPRRRERKKSSPPSPKLTSNGLPPTPKVHMGACFSKVFNCCPLGIHCTASWIHPESRDQHILIGAEEGLYTLNLNQLHDAFLHLLFPRRTIWMVVVKGQDLSFPESFFLVSSFIISCRCVDVSVGQDDPPVSSRSDWVA